MNDILKHPLVGENMFKYVNDISKLAQDIVKNYSSNFNVAVDATLGNGFDTDFLVQYYDKVYSFDIQSCAIDNYREECSKKVTLINDSHEFLNKYIDHKVDCVMYNLGYLPGGDKNITTEVQSTIDSIKTALELLNSNGIITVCIYAHNEGQKERERLLEFATELPKKYYGVMLHSFMNRNNAPELLIIEKK
jgi:hypothetical protein